MQEKSQLESETTGVAPSYKATCTIVLRWYVSGPIHNQF